MSFKLQFACVALALLAVGPALAFGPIWLLVPALLLLLAVALGWPLVLATARRQAPLIGFTFGLLVGAGFVLARSATILIAMIRLRLGGALSGPGA